MKFHINHHVKSTISGIPGEPTEKPPWNPFEARGVHQGVALQGHRARAAGEGIGARDLDKSMDWRRNKSSPENDGFLHSLPSIWVNYNISLTHHYSTCFFYILVG